MFGRFFRRNPEPLKGAPAVPRLKTYSAESGYAYQYVFRGRRESRGREGSGTEYVFDVASGSRPSMAVAVVLPERAAASWEARHGRALVQAERYAIAKLALLQAFDEQERPAELSREVTVSAAQVDAILETLGID